MSVGPSRRSTSYGWEFEVQRQVVCVTSTRNLVRGDVELLFIVPGLAREQQTRVTRRITASDPFPVRRAASVHPKTNGLLRRLRSNQPRIAQGAAAVVQHLMEDASHGEVLRGHDRSSEGSEWTGEMLQRLRIDQLEIFVGGVANDDIDRRHGTGQSMSEGPPRSVRLRTDPLANA